MAVNRVAIVLRMEEDTMERVRNAVWHIGRGLTITSVIESEVRKAVAELERHNGGKPFPMRGTPLPGSPRNRMS